MKLKKLNKTAATEVEIGAWTILFSYSTPVAANGPGGFFRTEEKFSPTTSKHINKWLAGAKAQLKPQSFFDRLVEVDPKPEAFSPPPKHFDDRYEP